MKFCPKCGKALNDDAKFCGGCGATIASAAPSPRPAYNPAPNPAPPPMGFVAPTADPIAKEIRKKTLTKIREVATSPLYIVWMIILSAYFIIMSITMIDLYGNAENVVSLVVMLLTVVLSVLSVIGVLSVLISAAGNNGNAPLSTAGYTMLKTVTIFKLVMVCIVSFLYLIGLFMSVSYINRFSSFFGESAFSTDEGQGFISSVIVGIAFLVLSIIYYACRCATLSNIKRAIFYGRPNTGASVFVQVINYLLFVFYAGFGIYGFAQISGYHTNKEIIVSLGLIGMGVMFLLEGLLLNKYNREMRKIMY